MSLRITPENKLHKIVVIGDRVLIKPRKTEERTRTGLYLPATVQDKEEVSSGYIIKAGPGYAIPYPAEGDDEPWKEPDEKVKYIPLQAKEGDLAIYLKKGAYEVAIDGEKFFIVSQANILMLEREEDL